MDGILSYILPGKKWIQVSKQFLDADQEHLIYYKIKDQVPIFKIAIPCNLEVYIW